MRKFYSPLVIILSVVGLDQCLKYYVKNNMYPGEKISLAGNWAYLYYTENPGMAFGIEWGGETGKLILTVFRLILVVAGFIYLYKILSKADTHSGFIRSISFILAGAIGNIVDSVFYGVLYKGKNMYDGGWLKGWVVDMLYFPIIETERFTFFSPIFNLADSAITGGVLALVLFQNRYFPKQLKEQESESEILNNSVENSNFNETNKGIDS